MTFNDLEGQMSFSLNDLDNVKVKYTKFEASILNSFETIKRKSE